MVAILFGFLLNQAVKVYHPKLAKETFPKSTRILEDPNRVGKSNPFRFSDLDLPDQLCQNRATL